MRPFVISTLRSVNLVLDSSLFSLFLKTKFHFVYLILSPAINTGSDELKLEVARTCHVLSAGAAVATGAAAAAVSLQQQQQHQQQPSSDVGGNEAPILVGYLWKKSQSASRADETNPVWFRRWFVLKRDNCLYYFKNQEVNIKLIPLFLALSLASTSSPYSSRLFVGVTLRSQV